MQAISAEDTTTTGTITKSQKMVFDEKHSSNEFNGMIWPNRGKRLVGLNRDDESSSE